MREIDRRISVCIFRKRNFQKVFFLHHLEPLWLNIKTDDTSPVERRGFLYIWHDHSSVICHLKTRTQWEGERSNFSIQIGFSHTILCKYLSSVEWKRDYAAVFISIITVNITIPGSRHGACFICHDDLPCSRTGMSERLFRSMWIRKEQRYWLMLEVLFYTF